VLRCIDSIDVKSFSTMAEVSRTWAVIGVTMLEGEASHRRSRRTYSPGLSPKPKDINGFKFQAG